MDKNANLKNAMSDYLIELTRTKNKSPEMAATITELYKLLLK
ncbi:hypothetical protein [Pediococcus pentosaceus]|nr:hypothetical protein [Pediococcus pentosaceus]AHA04698.1 hypothetical protein T256_02420 [Pediococcus pentosaceus SL4]